MQLTQQQQNLNTYLNNIPYEYKQQVHNDLKMFVTRNEYFWCRTNIQRNNMDQYFSFIQVVGFITIGKNMVEIRIMIPHNYPLAAPQFDILYNPESYQINNQGALIAKQTITIRQNAQGDQLIRLNSTHVANVWMNPHRRNVIEAFTEVSRELNNPPMLIPLARDNNVMKSIKNISFKHQPSNGLTQKVMSQIEEGIFQLQEKQMVVDSMKMDNEYKQARVNFINRNAGKLEKVLKAEERKVSAQLAQMRTNHQQMIIKNNIDPLLVMTPKDQAKVQAYARHDAVKEAQRKLIQCLQSNLSNGHGRWQSHKAIIRQFYEQMFEAEQQYLKVCD